MPAPLISPPPGDESPRPRPGALLPALSLALLLATIFTGGLFWASRAGVLIPATPTPSATPRAPLTATPDFRATRTAEDAATQIAYAAALATRTAHSLAETTPDAPAGGEPSPAVPMGNLTATAIAELAAEEGSQVAATAAALATADALATAQAILDSVTPPDFPLETPTEVLVNVPVVVSGETPTHPSEGAPPAPALTDTPTETPSPTFTSPPPTPSATPFATPTPTLIFALNSMRGVIDRQNAAARVGPASFYTQTATIGMGTQVSLLARDAGGEWVYICCTPNNAPAWIRSVSARPVENPTLPAPLSDLNQNDIRWLAVRGPDPGLAPVPMLAPPSPADFPMFRHDRGNTARVAALPRLPLAPAWSNQGGLAGQPYTSGAVMAGSTVFAASGDGHLYAFQRDSGSQAWRFNLGEVVRTAPLIDGAQVFVVTESGRLFALDNQGQAAVQRWMTPLGGAPRAAILPAPNRLVLTMRQADGERLLIVDRGNGAVLRNINLGGGQSVAPALSAQTVYVASDLIRAYDLWSGDLVWQSNEGTQFTTPPLLMWPGVEAASELYAADAMGRLLAYDANTGQLLWATAVGGTATGIAANNTTVFVSGPGFVRAFARMQRAEGQMLWSAGITGSVPGGPIVDEARVLAANDNGTLQYLDAVTGALIAANVQTPPLAGAALAVEPWFFAPGQNAVLFAARESP